MENKKSLVPIILLLLTPMFLSILSPSIYGVFLGFAYRGNPELIADGINHAITYILAFNHVIVIMIISAYMKKSEIKWKDIGTDKENITWTKLLLGLGVGVGCFVVLNLLPFLFNLVEMPLSNNSTNGLVFFIASITIAPIIEELVFRGFGIRMLSKIVNTKAAIIITAACFSLLHMYNGLWGLLTTFIVGLVFGYTYNKTKSIYPCIIAHFAINLGIGITYMIMLA